MRSNEIKTGVDFMDDAFEEGMSVAVITLFVHQLLQVVCRKLDFLHVNLHLENGGTGLLR